MTLFSAAGDLTDLINAAQNALCPKAGEVCCADRFTLPKPEQNSCDTIQGYR